MGTVPFTMNARIALSAAMVSATAVLIARMASSADAQGRGTASGTPPIGPDIIVSDLPAIAGFGAVGGTSAYALATSSCNLGDDAALWQGGSDKHPVIGQHLYRLKDGRFEQIGMSWVKHGWAALNFSCGGQCNGQLLSVLNVGCSDPYDAGLNGDQNGFPGCGGTCSGLGPRSEVNAVTGVFAWPYSTIGQSGDAIYKRLQVHNDDLDPSVNAGARYFGEGHYVTQDDAFFGNQHNNASYREIVVTGQQTFGLSFIGQTETQKSAVEAWPAIDPSVDLETFFDNDGGKYIVATKVSQLPGAWQYEYALYNMCSHRSARSFAVPIPVGVTVSAAGFHDVDYHSGDGEGGVTYDGADWPVEVGAPGVSWVTETFAANPNANALRWGTLYNFRFEAGAPPADGEVTVGLFRGAGPADLVVSGVPVPAAPPGCPWDCDGSGDGVVSVVDLLALLGQYDPGSPGVCGGGSCDFNGDGCVDVVDLLKLLAHYDPQGAGCL